MILFFVQISSEKHLDNFQFLQDRLKDTILPEGTQRLNQIITVELVTLTLVFLKFEIKPEPTISCATSSGWSDCML